MIVFLVYATKEECEKDQKKLLFNCYQRVHQVIEIIIKHIR